MYIYIFNKFSLLCLFFPLYLTRFVSIFFMCNLLLIPTFVFYVFTSAVLWTTISLRQIKLFFRILCLNLLYYIFFFTMRPYLTSMLNYIYLFLSIVILLYNLLKLLDGSKLLLNRSLYLYNIFGWGRLTPPILSIRTLIIF